MRQSLLLIAVLIIGAAQTAHAGILTYEFSGVLSPGSSSHIGISDTETWKARFLIDDATPSTSPGEYPNSVLSADIEFSGSFAKHFVFQAGFGVSVLNDANFGAFGTFDGVGAFIANGAESLNASVLSTNLTVLAGDTLPGAGTTFTGNIGTLDFEYLVGGNLESVRLNSSNNDVLFVASVPEPGSFGLLALVAVAMGVARRRNAAISLSPTEQVQ